MERDELVVWLTAEINRVYATLTNLKGKEKYVETGRCSAYMTVLEKVRPAIFD